MQCVSKEDVWFSEQSHSCCTWPESSWSELSPLTVLQKIKFYQMKWIQKYSFQLVCGNFIFFAYYFHYRFLCVNQKWCFCGSSLFDLQLHAPILREQHLFYLLHSKPAPLLPPTAPDISYQSHYSPQEVAPKLPPSHRATNSHLHPSLIRLARRLIHADHSKLQHLEGWLWGTYSCFTFSYWTMLAARRGAWLLTGVPQVAPDSLIALVMLKMGLWCHYWRSGWLRIADIIQLPSFIQVCHLPTMNWGSANLSVVAWPLIKSQIITVLPYVS